MIRGITLVSLFLPFLFLIGCSDDTVSPVASDSVDAEQLSSSIEDSGLETLDAASVRTPVENFVAPLSGDQEVPPVDTRSTGLAKFQLKGDEIGYHLNVSRMEEVTQAHIHCGSRGVNGPVVVFLFGFVPGGVTANGRLAAGVITAADVISRPDSPACPGGIASFEELLAKMRAGETYANVHTVPNPGGEVRGQIDRGNGVGP